MTEFASKDILNNAVLPDVTSTVWYISPDISEEHAVHIFKTEKVTEKCRYISTRPHSIIYLRNIHHSHHHEDARISQGYNNIFYIYRIN